MGDAGPLSPQEAFVIRVDAAETEHETPLREVTVLVTGFGVCLPWFLLF